MQAQVYFINKIQIFHKLHDIHMPYRNFISKSDSYPQTLMRNNSKTEYIFEKSKALFKREMDEIDYMNLLRKMEVDIHLQRILLKMDRAGMYHSLEIRVPLLSNAMLQLAEQYNFKDCITDGYGKMPLRRLLMTKVDKSLVMQPKRGFTVPIDTWIRNELKQEITERILDIPTALSPYFDKKALQKLLFTHINKGQNEGWFIWAIYSLIMWHHTHLDKPFQRSCFSPQ